MKFPYEVPLIFLYRKIFSSRLQKYPVFRPLFQELYVSLKRNIYTYQIMFYIYHSIVHIYHNSVFIYQGMENIYISVLKGLIDRKKDESKV